MDLLVAQTEIELTLLTRDQEHVAVLLDAMASVGLRGRAHQVEEKDSEPAAV